MDAVAALPDVTNAKPPVHTSGTNVPVRTAADFPYRTISPLTDDRPWKKALLSLTATGWYLSFVIHITAYVNAGLVFWWLGMSLLPEPFVETLPAIRAALDDENTDDEQPALEIIPTPGIDVPEIHSSREQLASHLIPTDDGNVDALITDALMSTLGQQDRDTGAGSDSAFLRIPETGLAVTKGSFTAWTIPESPAPRQLYQIVIEIRLPEKLKRYRLSDLSGQVIGTDGYRQKLPWDSRVPGAARVIADGRPETVNSRTIVVMESDKVQLVIKVPGAERLIKDTIRIRSRRLREEQQLNLVFDGSLSQGDGSSSEP